MGIINLQGVTKIYQTKEVETVALENVNLEVKAGEFLSVMGPSGCSTCRPKAPSRWTAPPRAG